MKLQIAVALSHRAKILIFDEATSGLDPLVRMICWIFCWNIFRTRENTVLLSSHIISDLEKVSRLYSIYPERASAVYGK